MVAGDVDVLDRGDLAFGDDDRQLDAVAVERDDLRLDRDVVLAAVVVLAGQFLRHAVEREAVERLAFGQADVLEALEQILGLEVLVALQFDLRDRRPLLDRDDEDVALAGNLHVAEEAGLVQRAHRLLHAFASHVVAFFDRQIGENGTGGNALQAVDADVRGDERVHGKGFCGKAGEQ